MVKIISYIPRKSINLFNFLPNIRIQGQGLFQLLLWCLLRCLRFGLRFAFGLSCFHQFGKLCCSTPHCLHRSRLDQCPIFALCLNSWNIHLEGLKIFQNISWKRMSNTNICIDIYKHLSFAVIIINVKSDSLATSTFNL